MSPVAPLGLATTYLRSGLAAPETCRFPYRQSAYGANSDESRPDHPSCSGSYRAGEGKERDLDSASARRVTPLARHHTLDCNALSSGVGMVQVGWNMVLVRLDGDGGVQESVA